MIKYIKYHLTIFIIVLLVSSVVVYFYQDQDVNISSLKDESDSLKSNLNREKSNLSKLKKELKKNNQFLNEHKSLHIIDKPETLDPIRVSANITKYLETYFDKPSFRFSKKTKNSSSKRYITYSAKLQFNYTSTYDLKKLLVYINNNFMINVNSISYDSKNRRFAIALDFIGLKGEDIFSKKALKKKKKKRKHK